MKIRRMHATLLLLLVILLAACAASPQTKLYVLAAMAGDSFPPAGEVGADMTVGLGPVTLPDYLDRPQIMTRATENRLEAADFHRWAEPLSANISRVLAENLAARLPAPRILLFPWNKSQAPAWRVRVEFLRFEAGPDDAMHCTAIWSVAGGNGTVAGEPRRSDLAIPVPAGDFDAMVRAASEAIARLSREIAEEILRVRAGRTS